MATTTTARVPSGGSSRTPRRPRAGAAAWLDAALGGPLPQQLERWDSPALSYAVIQGATLLLLGLGLVMVLSSSSVDSLTDDQSPFAVGRNQATFAALGLVVMLVASRLPVTFLRVLAPLSLVAALGLQALVFSPLGVDILGNRNWISVAGFSVQPSEIGKIALVLWCATALAMRQADLDRWNRWLGPLGLGVAPVVGLVLAGGDLGTVLVMMTIVLACLFTAGVPLRHLAVPVLGAAVLAAGFVLASPNRRQRFTALFGGTDTDLLHHNYQPVHGLWGLASGGLTGVGLGGSRQKWDWLPEANSDYIFAIIGEELGMIGTVVVLLLFCALGWGCVRVVRRSDDLFTQVAVAGFAAWILGQAWMNIAVVLKLAPVVGLPLPLISAGGSALVCSLAAIGLVLACARSVPGARAALRSRPGLRLPRRPGRGETSGPAR